jgi:hypothetical protein
MGESCDSDTADGTYETFRDRIVFTWFNGLELAFAFAVDSDGRLTLTPEAETPEDDAFVWATSPWDRVED